MQTNPRRVSLTDAKGAANFFGDNDSSQIVHSSDNASSLHISFSFSAAALGPLAEGAGTAQAVTGGVSHRTNDTPSVFAALSHLPQRGRQGRLQSFYKLRCQDLKIQEKMPATGIYFPQNNLLAIFSGRSYNKIE